VAPARSDDDQLVVALDADLPNRLAVGAGNCLFVSGSCFHRRRPVRRLTLAVDGERHRVIAHGMPSHGAARSPAEDCHGSAPRRAGWAGFWGVVPFRRTAASRTAAIELIAGLDGGEEASRHLGELELMPRLEPIEIELPPVPGEGPLVAICMATFEPPGELLELQLASLRDQTHRRWVCLINDDGSSTASFERLRSLTADDPRFAVTRSPRRRGLYRNFERTLGMVPTEAEYVALCDQDDRWYPEKLSALLEEIDDANLAYSDMRIVLEGSGRVLSETFWSYKRNNYRNLSSLLLDNTVTGAASLFRRRLLDLALPFPPAFEDSYHDHWIASVALATGRVTYLDRPLYDYVQHSEAATPRHPSGGPPPPRRRLRDRLANGRVPYFKHLIRVAVAARVLELRCSELLDGGRRRAVHRVARLAQPPEPVPWLVARSLRPLVGRNETLHFERSLLNAVAWRCVSAWRARRGRRSSAEG
jgi:glycosyltransferase involved in cell wall biosynthesis